MGILSKFRAAERAANRFTTEALYAQALREVESGIRRDGLWAKALSEAGMRKTDAQALYLELRVQSLRDEMELQTHQETQAALKQQQTLLAQRAHEREFQRLSVKSERDRPVQGLRDWLNVLLGLAAVMTVVVLILAIVGK